MHDLNCRSARLWLQAPHELWRGDMRTLDAHLASCAACREFNARQLEMDRRLRQSLLALGSGGSVSPAVRARISSGAKPGPLARGRRGPKRGRWTLPSVLWPGWLGMGVALMAAVVAVFVPQYVPDAGGGVPSAGAASHLVRKEIGYPFALDPTRRDHLLAGAWGQVYESWNAGAGWRALAPLPRGLVIRALAIDVARPRHYLVATKHSLYLSVDAGHHWRRTAVNLQGAMNMFLVQDPRTPATFYLGPSTLWKSRDGGFSWRRAGRGAIFAPYGIQALEPGPRDLLYTGIWGGGVAESRNGGITWQRQARGLAPNVMDVEVGPRGELWAATDRGAYRSTNGGRLWRRAGPRSTFFATSVLPGPGYVLVGGDGMLYRSRDGGRHWQLAANGLPLGPSINSLVADPHRPKRVYASLNSDGIFRSDDAGRHWTAINAGLPLSAGTDSSRAQLFLRHGALWITDRTGADPEVLTVEQNVATATLAPDGAAVAYLAVTPDTWAVRVVGAGGSMPVTLATGGGARPTALRWSPDSSLLAIVRPAEVMVHDLSSEHWSWPLRSGRQLLGWAPGGRSLFFWNRSTGRIMVRRWDTGTGGPYGQTVVGAAPALSANGARIALASHGTLATGVLPGPLRVVSRRVAGCRMVTWTNDNGSLLLRCGRGLEEFSPQGRPRAHLQLPTGAALSAAPDGTILLLRGSRLWSWSPDLGLRPMVKDATPAAPLETADPTWSATR